MMTYTDDIMEAAREAAIHAEKMWLILTPEQEELIRSGGMDNDPTVQAAAYAITVERAKHTHNGVPIMSREQLDRLSREADQHMASLRKTMSAMGE